MNTQPRAWLNLASCADRCYRASDIAGLLFSAGIVNAPGWVPRVIRESDKCIAIPYPKAGHHLHLVFFPKRDIRDIADLTADDQPYVMDCFAVIRSVVNEQGLTDYRVYTNGPKEQDISRLHFHLVAWGAEALVVLLPVRGDLARVARAARTPAVIPRLF